MSVRKTIEERQLESDKKYNFEFKYLEEPLHCQHKVKIYHNKCGNTILASPNNHMHRYCKYCTNKVKKTKEDWQVNSDNIHGLNEFIILEDISNIKTKYNVLHKKCGQVIKMTYNNHINHGSGCRYCDGKYKKSLNEWIAKTEAIHGKNEYVFLSTPNTTQDIVEIKHIKCNNILRKNMKSFLNGARGCEFCYSFKSNNANKIENILKHNNIVVEKEKTFDGCIDKRKLRFDFYLPKYNLCIEYDGIQHFKDEIFFKKDLSYIQSHDELKNKFCYKNKIELFRISYKDNLVSKMNKILKFIKTIQS